MNYSVNSDLLLSLSSQRNRVSWFAQKSSRARLFRLRFSCSRKRSRLMLKLRQSTTMKLSKKNPRHPKMAQNHAYFEAMVSCMSWTRSILHLDFYQHFEKSVEVQQSWACWMKYSWEQSSEQNCFSMRVVLIVVRLDYDSEMESPWQIAEETSTRIIARSKQNSILKHRCFCSTLLNIQLIKLSQMLSQSRRVIINRISLRLILQKDSKDRKKF